MRITNQIKHSQTIYNYQRSMQGVNKHNLELSSGTKIQNSYEGSAIYNDAMRLESEIQTLEQVASATSKSQNFSKNSDSSLLEFSKQLENFKVKLVQAASDVHSQTSLDAIANDLQGIKNHLVNIANTSVNGQFLFSGSAVAQKPIADDGSYRGNRDHMTTVGGSNIEIPFNVTGYDLFLGRDKDYNKILTTNVKLADLTRPDVAYAPKYLNGESRLERMVGLNYVKDTQTLNADYDFNEYHGIKFQNTYFYLQGTKSDGTSFTSKFTMTHDASMQSLLEKIGQEFGNTATSRVVDVTINNDGQINIKDLTQGNQTLNMHLVAATEQVANKAGIAAAIANDAAGTSPASVDSLAALEAAATAGTVYITEFTKSGFKDENGNVTDSFDFDKVRFEKNSNKVTGTISQVDRSNGEFATSQTRLSQAAGTSELYEGTRDRYNIDDQEIMLKVKSRTGIDYEIKISLGNEEDLAAGRPATNAKFEVTGTKNGVVVFPTLGATAPASYDIWHATEFGTFKTPTKDVSYKQLTDIIAMAASDSLPDGTAYDDYNEAIIGTKGSVEVVINNRGEIELTDKTKGVTDIEIAMYSSTVNQADKFYGDSTGTTPATSQGRGSVFGFSENNAITIDEPSVDIFKDLQDMIDAVRYGGKQRTDAEGRIPRNTGLQGGITRIDHIMDHISKEKVKIGSFTTLLKDTNERASIMKVNIASVKSDVIDADYGETYLKFTQKMMSYQAMLQATSKINQLSLLNYM